MCCAARARARRATATATTASLFLSRAACTTGNLISDVVGLGAGGVIESAAAGVGLAAPPLSTAQAATRAANATRGAAAVLGISLGCLLGMFPLLFYNEARRRAWGAGGEGGGGHRVLQQDSVFQYGLGGTPHHRDRQGCNQPTLGRLPLALSRGTFRRCDTKMNEAVVRSSRGVIAAAVVVLTRTPRRLWRRRPPPPRPPTPDGGERARTRDPPHGGGDGLVTLVGPRQDDARLRKIFIRYDLDGDGTLDRAEIGRAFADAHQHPSESQVRV